MRPVNLIPQDERRGDRPEMRTGPFSYVLLAGLGAALLAVVLLALTSKQISDKKSEVASLQQQEQQTRAKAQSLQAFADFRSMQEARTTTVTNLAQSRFDWQRVLNELSRVIPAGVSLSQLTGTVDPSVAVGGNSSTGLRSSVQGPALEMTGCAPTQDVVAGLISSLEEVDGVTRVGMQSAARASSDGGGSTGAATTSGAATASGSGSSGSDACPPNYMNFSIVVAFDAVPTPASATSASSSVGG